MSSNFYPSCTSLAHHDEIIEAGHGGGGTMMHKLLDQVLPIFGEVGSSYEALDGAVFCSASGERLAFTTDSYVVSPLFFPGGDIGRLAVNGTINDLAMCGAKAKVLSCSLIIEQGVAKETVLRVVQSMAQAASEAGVRIVTGDTKVVGTGSNLYVNTSGVGWMLSDRELNLKRARIGDKIILCGDIGRHAVAVMAARVGLEFDPPILSDTQALINIVEGLMESGAEVLFMRDPTRGGLASTLVELATASGLGVSIEEPKLPIHPGVRGACEVLGFDPLYLANEGCFVSVVSAQDAELALTFLLSQQTVTDAMIIGELTGDHRGMVAMKTAYGTRRLIQMADGELFPRIC